MRPPRATFAPIVAVLALGSARCNSNDCIDYNPDVGSLCLPDTLQADEKTIIEVRESCNQCSSPPQCDATLINGIVNVQLHSQLCSDTTAQCTAICLQRTARCTLPPLASGDYTLVLPGNLMRALRVREGGVSSCQLPVQ
jgi:hypothetical protein